MWIVEDKGKNRYEIILGFPDVVLTADGEDTTLKKGSGDKGHQYWELDWSNPAGLRIMQYNHKNCYLGVNNQRIVVKKNPPADAIDLWSFRQVTKNVELNRCCYLRCTITGKLMDVPASQGNEGVHICLW